MKRSGFPLTICLSFLLFHTATVSAQPLLAPVIERETKEVSQPDFTGVKIPPRDELQEQLEKNQQLMDDLYVLLDSVPCNPQASTPLKKQLDALEATNEEIYLQLNEWNRRDFIQSYHLKLVDQIKGLEALLTMPVSDNNDIQVQLWADELTVLQAKLKNNSWKQDAEKVWRQQHQNPVEVLTEELTGLKQENKLLRLELQRMSGELREIHLLLKKIAEQN